MEITKQEYIDKLNKELQNVDNKYQHIININSMLGEDYRSQGLQQYNNCLKLTDEIKALKSEITTLQEILVDRKLSINQANEANENHEMQHEEDLTRFGCLSEICEKLNT